VTPSAPSIVIVDDEVTLAVVMRMLILQEWPDAQVSLLTEPGDLRAQLLEVPSEALVLMDRRLGGVDSYGVISGLLEARPDVRVVMLSASLGPEEIAHARAAGAVAAYEKPGGLGAWHQLFASVISPVANP